MPDNSIVKNAFYESMRLSDIGYNTWVSKVRELARVYNLDISSFDFSNRTKNLIKKTVKQKFILDWKTKLSRIDKYPILRTYSLFKFDFSIEPYLIHVRNSKFRNAMAKFRSSSHTLEIEKGRHMKPKTPLELRLCKECNVLENEIHFLLYCKLYTESRKIYMDNVTKKYPLINDLSDEDKLTFLISFNDAQTLTWTAKFIFHAFEKRNPVDS